MEIQNERQWVMTRMKFLGILFLFHSKQYVKWKLQLQQDIVIEHDQNLIERNIWNLVWDLSKARGAACYENRKKKY